MYVCMYVIDSCRNTDTSPPGYSQSGRVQGVKIFDNSIYGMNNHVGICVCVCAYVWCICMCRVCVCMCVITLKEYSY